MRNKPIGYRPSEWEVMEMKAVRLLSLLVILIGIAILLTSDRSLPVRLCVGLGGIVGGLLYPSLVK